MMGRINAFGRRRILAVIAIAVLFVLAGIGDELIGHRVAVEANPADVNLSAVNVARGTSSTAWYCAGPLPFGARNEYSSIAIANVSSRSVTGEMLIAASTGHDSRMPVAVAANAQAVLALPRTGTPGFASVSVITNGPGIGVSQIIHGPGGPSTAPCVTHATTNAFVASGGTKDPADVTLSLYDPSATPVVASVTFATSAGFDEPPAFQGLSVLAGQMITLDVGQYVVSRSVVAPIVHASGGHLVVGAIETVPFRQGVESSLLTATARPAKSWTLSAGPAGSASRQSFYVLNSGTTRARVFARLVSGSGSANVDVSVAAGAVDVFGLAPDPNPSALRWATISSTGSAITVARTTTLVTNIPPQKMLVISKAKQATKTPATKTTTKTTKPPSVSPAQLAEQARAAAALLPGLAPGFAATAATTQAYRSWLFPGGEVDPQMAEVITITNPTAMPVRVVVRVVASKSSLPHLDGAPQLTSVVIAPRQTASVALDAFVSLRYSLPVLVEANAQVVAGELLYARGSSGSLGFSASAGIPVG